ncbi:MAG: DNA polymerase III subunit gamma/tau [Acidobacteria bacterium]|nr:DNA polymerase III subunit gamma/tau [Acidobacteriota bacterium]
MSYQVIARKWRPQTFDEVTGQEAITRTLTNAVRTGRLHHAYIFSGSRGVGKTTTARILAKALNCAEGQSDKPCGLCPSCQEIARGGSMDVLEIDAATHTGIDAVREVIISNIGLSPARDRYRIYIIDEFHQLSVAAFNALLKSLEEPPAHSVFIMATTELQKVPETILSRCQVYEFKLIPEVRIVERLRKIAEQEGIRATGGALRRVAAAGEGSMRDAQSLFDQVISYAGTDLSEADVMSALGIVGLEHLSAACSAIARHDTRGVLGVVDQLVSQGYDLRTFCRELMAYFRNLLVFKTMGRDPELLPIDESEVDSFRTQSALFTEAELVRGFHLLTEIEQHVRLSPEPRFQVEIGLMKLSQMRELRTVAELVERLGRLEARLSPESPASADSATQAGQRPVAPSGRTVSSQPRSTAPGGRGQVRPPRTGTPPSRPSSPPAPAATTPKPTPDAPAEEPPRRKFDQPVERILTRLEEQKRKLLVAELHHASNIEWENGELRLTFSPSEQDHREAIDNRESRRLIEEVASAELGVTPILKFLTSGQSSEKPAPVNTRPAEVDDPVVQAVVRKFKGEIIDTIDKLSGE